MAKRAVASLILQLRADNRQMVKGFRGADQAAGKMTANIGRAVRATAAFGAAVGGAAVAGAVATLSRMATQMDAISKRADRLNITTEALTALDFQAGQAGVSTQILDRALRNIADRSTQAASGQKALAEAFGVLGLNAAEIARQEPDVALGNIADALNAIENPAQRTSLAMDILGEKAGVELATLLKSGSEGIEEFRQRAETLGLTFSRQVGAQMEAFNDSLDVLRQLALGASRQFAVNFAPVMKAFAQLIFDNEGAVAKLRNSVAVDLADGIARSIGFLLNLPKAIQGTFAAAALSIAEIRVFAANQVQGILEPLTRLANLIEMTPGKYSPIGVVLRELRDAGSDVGGGIQALKEAQRTLDDIAASPGLGDQFLANYERAKVEVLEVGKTVDTVIPKIKELNEAVQGRDPSSAGGGAAGRGGGAALSRMRDPWQDYIDRILTAQESVKQLGVTIVDTFAGAAGDAVGQALVRAKSLEQAFLDMSKAIVGRVVSALVELGVQMALVQALSRSAIAASGSAAASAVGGVVASTAAGASAIAAIWGPAATAASIATFGAASGIGLKAYLAALAGGTAATVAAQSLQAGVGAVLSAAGQAHDGMTMVPREGSYILDKGERVLSPDQNADLTRFLQRAGGRGLTVNVKNYGSSKVDVQQTPAGIDVIIREVEERFLRSARTGSGAFARGLAWARS